MDNNCRILSLPNKEFSHEHLFPSLLCDFCVFTFCISFLFVQQFLRLYNKKKFLLIAQPYFRFIPKHVYHRMFWLFHALMCYGSQIDGQTLATNSIYHLISLSGSLLEIFVNKGFTSEVSTDTWYNKLNTSISCSHLDAMHGYGYITIHLTHVLKGYCCNLCLDVPPWRFNVCEGSNLVFCKSEVVFITGNSSLN